MTGQVILVNTFISECTSGSPQFLHIFDDEEKLNAVYSSYQVNDEFDHSFVFFSDNGTIVKWKNKAGRIQFCGSGAYAIAWYYLKHLDNKKILMKIHKLELLAENITGKIILTIPNTVPTAISENDDYQLFFDTLSGIYFIHLNSIEELRLIQFDQLYNIAKRPSNIHGLCAFYWDENSEGHIRYFTPWHGRDEDYVTGSIHQYLSPLIRELFNRNVQIWKQISPSGGELKSEVFKDHVNIRGACIVCEA